MTLQNCTRTQSQTGNRYLLDSKTKKTLICPPILAFILLQQEKGCDIPSWIAGLPQEEILLEGYGTTSKDELHYYYQKYLLLKTNGYFQDFNQVEQLTGTITPEVVKKNLANLPILTFEVTDRCQLNCKYCGYGPFYRNFDPRTGTNLDIATAKEVLRYLQDLWNSSLNISHNRVIYLGYYGGEPLLNFPFIEESVLFSQGLHLEHNIFNYSITTNGMLLERYMDFLVQYNFNLLISLDGNEKNNEYRSTLSGNPAFPTILRNIRALQKKYPAYFEKQVNFNAVVHNKNSVAEIFQYFKETFNKIPSIGALNTNGISEENKDEFWKTYANITEGLYNSEDYSRIEREMFIQLPNIQTLSTFIDCKTDSVFTDYNDLLYSAESPTRCPSGTCLPFAKKFFVTVSGKILACEKIGQEYELGHASPHGVSLDFEDIARRYNLWFESVRPQCQNCYHADLCSQCLFYLPLSEEKVPCPGFMNEASYALYVSLLISHLEKNPSLYRKIIKEVITN